MSQEEMLKLMEEQNRLLREQNELKRMEMALDGQEERIFSARMQSTFDDLDKKRLGYGDDETSFNQAAQNINARIEASTEFSKRMMLYGELRVLRKKFQEKFGKPPRF